MSRDETMDPENQQAFTAHMFRCHACAAKERAAKDLQKEEHDDAGLMFAVELDD